MKLIINNSSMQPIYEQICTQIKNKILSGELKQEEMLPSVRTFAKELRVSALTVKRPTMLWNRRASSLQCMEKEALYPESIKSFAWKKKKKRSRNGSGTGDPQSKELRHDRSRDTGAV